MTLILRRLEQLPAGTFGLLMTVPGDLQWHTMEEDWRNNMPRVSCIPEGRYKLARTIYHKHGYETFEVMDVPGRTRILIHPANTEEDVEGCIGLGMRRGKIRVPKDEDTGLTHVLKDGIVESRKAFEEFMALMSGADEDWLVVQWASGLPKESPL